MSWKPTTATTVSRVLDFESKWMQCSEAEFSNKIITDKMDLDNHLLASTTCGLISDFNGASNFINDKPDTSQVTLTCSWTRKLWVERYKDLQSIVNQNIENAKLAKHRQCQKPLMLFSASCMEHKCSVSLLKM